MLVNRSRALVISEEEARQKILEVVRALPPRVVPLLEALDRFARRDVFARIALPRFDNSSMDGYALAASSSPKNARLKIVGEQAAGIDADLNVRAGEAVRILTGAPIPRGADAVIMQEDVRREGNEIVLTSEIEADENIRRRGADMSEGQKLLSLGERIHSSTIALLATQGNENVEIGATVRASIVTTGDEIIPPGRTLRPGEIYDSNSLFLHALSRKTGAEVISVRHCPDDAVQTEAALLEGVSADVMIICGGVSVGARDFVKPALKAIGASLDFWRVAVRPGKPFLFGRTGSCFIFGLPGNPVSAYITFLLFVRPAILRLMGANDDALGLTSVPARLKAAVKNSGDRSHYLRGNLNNGKFSPVGRQESHAVFGLSRSNALLRLAPGEEIEDGAEIAVFLVPV